ncbi:MAG: hypothetical protein PF574_07015 [Candidatus Delongbacteria bacterium]|jgi:phage regulator Rha-like protein|nr:hypothetical protein [Candidatus Delongbacteria bacterium]
MLKKLMVVAFIFSMLLMVSCSDDSTSVGANSVSFRITDIHSASYDKLDSIWVANSDQLYNYDVNDRVDGSFKTYTASSTQYLEELTYSSLSDVRPLTYSRYSEYVADKMMGDFKLDFIYEDGKTKVLMMSVLDELGAYQNVVKTVYAYENEMLVSAIDSSFWSGENWDEAGRQNWTYVGGRLVEYISSFEQIEYVYENDNLTEKLYYDDWSGSLELQQKEEFVYENGILKEKLTYRNNEIELELSRKETYEYEGSHLSAIYQSEWEEIEWVAHYKTGFDYDSNGNLIAQIEYDWDSLEEVYVLDYKTEFTYEEESGNSLDVSKAMSPESFYTGMSEIEIFDYSMPSKVDNKVDKFIKLLEKQK